MLGESVFSEVVKGTCLFCRKTESIIHATDHDVLLYGLGALGVCDVCSFALGHAWNRSMGRQIVPVTPRFARTYVLVPKLPEGRPAEDVSSYQFLVGSDGFLPWFERVNAEGMICSSLEREYGCKTWPETLKRCYLGFASGGDFSEVLVAWAWGKSLDVKTAPRGWKTFSELLATPTPEAGFHLGIASGFESLLWRKEAQPDGNDLCVYLSARTLKYLRYQERQEKEDAQADVKVRDDLDDDDDDQLTIEFYKSSMSLAELSVVALLDDARRQRAEEAKRAEEEALAKAGSEDGLSVDGRDVGEVGEDEEDDGARSTRAAIIPPGFARPRTIVE
jgi:hypothetical protein